MVVYSQLYAIPMRNLCLHGMMNFVIYMHAVENIVFYKCIEECSLTLITFHNAVLGYDVKY